MKFSLLTVCASTTIAPRRTFRPGLVLAAVLCASLAARVQAGSIGVNFGVGGGTLAATDSAGVTPFAQTHYNNVTSGASSLALNDGTGTLTTASLSTSGSSFTGFHNAMGPIASGPDETLNADLAYASLTQSFSVTGIPYASYSLIVYDLGYHTGDVQGISLSGMTYYTLSPNPQGTGYIDSNSATPFLYTPGTGTTAVTATSNADYVLFTGLTGSSLTVTDTLVNSGSLADLGGFQIISTPLVPEPSTWALLLGGAGLLVAVSIRRRVGT